MEDKKIRKLRKKELLEIILEQAKRIEKLEQQLETTEKKLNSKKIIIENAGSLAEASLKINDIFEKADEASKQYLKNVKEKCQKLEADTKKECQKKIDEANEYLEIAKLKLKEIDKKINHKQKNQTNKQKNNNDSKKRNNVKLAKVKKEI